MQSEDYSETLEDGIKKSFFEVNRSINDSKISISLTGELSERSSSYQGETHYFDFELFKNCTYTNIQTKITDICWFTVCKPFDVKN